MINKFITGVFSMLVTTTVFAAAAEINMKVMCDDSNIMLPLLKEKYDETPIWIGQVDAEDSVYASVIGNNETRTWSILIFNKDTSCIMESGEGFKFKIPESAGL